MFEEGEVNKYNPCMDVRGAVGFFVLSSLWDSSNKLRSQDLVTNEFTY